MSGLTTLTVITKTVVLLLGGAITLLARRAAKRTGSDALRLFAVGFAVITAGALLGGAITHVSGIGFRTGVFLRNLFMAAGFAILGYSLYAGNGADATIDAA